MKGKKIAHEIAKFERLLQKEARKLVREMEGYFDLLEYGI